MTSLFLYLKDETVLELITASLAQGDISLLTEYPDDLIQPHQKVWIQYIIAFRNRYGVLPKVKNLQDEFPNFVPLGDLSAPLQFVFDQTLEQSQKELFDQFANQILLADNLKEKQEYTIKLKKLLQQYGTGVNAISEWDRSNYVQAETVLDFPFPTLQELTGGISKADFISIVGRLGSAKTFILQWILRHFAQFNGKKVLYVSQEMTAADSFLRFDAMIAGFNALKLRQHGYESLKAEIQTAKELIKASGGDIIMSNNPLMTPSGIGELAYKYDADVIGIDGMYLLRADEKNTNRFENFALVSNAIRRLSLELEKPILGTSQTNRNSVNGAMVVENVSLSDALAQDSVMMLGCEMVSKTKTKAAVDLSVMKSRVSSDVSFPLLINFETSVIKDESSTKVTI